MNVEALNIVVPMAGRGSRFAQAGYVQPKPLIPVHGRPMIEVVIENLRPNCAHRFIFICQKEHIDSYGIDHTLQVAAPGAVVLPIEAVTEGAACTVLLSQDWIDSPAPLMIANCDQYVDFPIDRYLRAMEEESYDGFIMTMTADDPKWSFVRFDALDHVSEVVEKKVVSREATVGIYNYRHGSDFVAAAQAMMAAGDRVNNEFYVAPAYNYLIDRGARIGYLNIGCDRDGMFGLGVPEDLEYFNSLEMLPRQCQPQ